MFFRKTNIFGFTMIAAVLLVFLYSLSFNTTSVFAYSITMTTNNSIELDAVPGDDGVTIKDESINVISDCRSGYNLSIATPEGSDLYKYDNNTPAANASFTAVDGTSALSSSNNTNKWGYTLTSNPTSSTIFSPLSTTTSTLKTSSQTASPSSDINDTFHIYYGVKVDTSIVPGTYQMAQDGNNNAGTIVYYLTMDTSCTQYTVAFNPNGGTVTGGGNNPTQGIEIGVATRLSSADSLTAPTGASYTDAGNNTITGQADKLWTFWGWNTQIDGTGDWYKDREAVEDLANAGSTITLYAQWKQATLADMTTSTPVGTEKTIDHNEMQDMRPEVCYNSPITTAANAPAATLLDYRGKVTTGSNPESAEQYTVSKLADGNCWMTTNLNLGRSGTDGPNGNGTVTLTSDDTDLATNTTFTLPAGTTTSNTTATAATIRTTNTSGNNNNGTYYSWAAAVANTASISTSPTTSICPRSWDLPTDAAYTNLKTKANYSSSNLTTSAPSSFLVDGGFTDGATFYQTAYSHFWTNTTGSSSVAYGARVNATTMTVYNYSGTTYGGNKYYRKNIRCVASNGTATINYDSNGTSEYPATGSIAPQVDVEINSTRTTGYSFSRNGFSPNGWNTEPDGSGTSVPGNTLIANLGLKPGETITLYAQWTPQYTINYVHNCKTWAPDDANCTDAKSIATSNQKINLDASGNGSGTLKNYNAWTNLSGWKIKEWTTNADGTGTAYPVNSTYSVTGANPGDSITLYAHWVPLYSIQYDGNGASNSNGMGTTDQSTGIKSVKQTNVGEGDPVVLLASNFKRAGYGFAGWSTNPNATVTSGDKIYGPMETISAPAYPSSGNIITMYAVWVEAEKDGSNNPVYLQDFTASDCNALTKADFNTSTGVITPGSVIALTDKRDDEVYAIAKLADNNCWMIENLRLEHEGTVGNNKNDSSVTNQSLSQGYGGTTGTYGNFVGLAASESANFSNTTTSLSFADGGIYKSSLASPTDTYNAATSTLEDIGTSNYPDYRFPRYNSNNTQSLVDSTTYTQNYSNPSSPSDSGTNYRTSSNIYGYGNYYTWAAAMANTNYYTRGSSTSEAAGTSICPSNWHLPSSNGTAKEFGALSASYGGTGNNQNGIAQSGNIMSGRFRTFPNNFLYSGCFSGSSANNRGTHGYYWSRSTYTNNFSNRLFLDSSIFYPSDVNGNKYLGFSVRCLIGS